MPRAPMTGPLAEAYAAELAAARDAAKPMPARWQAIERAHILSQPWPRPHVRTHAVMLRLAVRDRDLYEALGQIVRLIAAGPASAAGEYPTGNTGRARVPIKAPMPVPDDLAALLATATAP